ncbi:MAG: exodeoxyribonuclease VII small subunit [Sandaracinaceae bacterium]|nr:exodeoxyribonuclease VII small subunit [Sandaracinaceae bacterium]MBK7152079.1 exodeoxyribonuclease VII small subunit [Sandaracinaceae bacterium]
MSTPAKRSRPEPTDASNTPGHALRAASFEAVMTELQSVVARLEEGELSLEESLLAFEKGVQLSREGSRRLEEAERRVEALLSSDAAAPDELSAP